MAGHSTDAADDTSAAHPFGRRLLLYTAGVTVSIIFVLAMLAGALLWELRQVHFPSPAEVTSRRVITLESADGHDLWGAGQQRFAPVDARNMPANVINAVLSIEDRHFYEHGAVDFPSILRALRENLTAGKTVAGGSTITQQLVKNLFVGPQRTYGRKIQEAAISMWIERHLSKNEILTSYLNNVYLGSGATGFPAAAKVYFNEDIGQLTLPQAAMLAGMINAPSQDDPFNDLDAARKRATVVLDAMVENGKLSPADALAAKLHPATPTKAEFAASPSGWFADWVHKKAAAVTPAFGGTVQIRTTLDTHLQQLATDTVKSTLAKYGPDKHATQAALVAMRPDGAVVAMVGGRSYAESQYNRAVQAQRQPGSAFKLFDYYAALRHGFTPNDEVSDAPVAIHGWHPENYGRHHHGKVTLAEAFANSLNDATVRLTQQIGIRQVIAAARDLGLRAPLQNNPSLALGTSEVTLLDLTSAYAAVRAGKAPVNAYGISAIKTGSDEDYVRLDRPGQAQHSLGQYRPELIDLLRGVVERGTGKAAALDGFAAGKTGTSQDYRDAWFVGFDNSLVVGVWVGNDDHSPMKKVTGGSLPAQIWKGFMQQANAPAVAQTAPPEPTTVGLSTVGQSKAEPQPSDQGDAGSPPQQGAQCNVDVCERFYHSFRASDCTYQPYWGPRQLCER